MYKADLRDKHFVIDLLTRAFDDNKSVNFVVRQDAQRVKRIARLMNYSYNVCNAFGEVWVSDDRAACALLLFPDRKQTTFKSILWDLKLAFSVVGIDRVKNVLHREGVIKANHPRRANFAYLWFLAVHPEQQGEGAGTRFLKTLLAECEKMKRDVYLETSMPRNLPFYDRLGFEVYETVKLTYTLYQLRKISTV